jgi:hypothetical protein
LTFAWTFLENSDADFAAAVHALIGALRADAAEAEAAAAARDCLLKSLGMFVPKQRFQEALNSPSRCSSSDGA